MGILLVLADGERGEKTFRGGAWDPDVPFGWTGAWGA